MIRKIAHLADIHIRKSPERNDEYIKVFNNLYKSLRKYKPDRILISGDLVNDYINLQGEQLILASGFLNELATIALVIITRGNHDYFKPNKKRVDAVKGIVESIKNKNIKYYDKTGFYNDDNVIWSVFHHGDGNTPWTKKYVKVADKIYIDLYHNPIRGCKSDTGFEMNSNSYFGINEFKGDFLMAGDIHLKQFLNKENTKAYCGSLISQTFSEGDDAFHGYLLWDIIDKTVEEIPIYNEYSHKNVYISQFTDFDDLDIDIVDPTEYNRIRLIWNTLPEVKNNSNKQKIIAHLKSKYNILSPVSDKKLFISDNKMDVSTDVTLLNVNESVVQHGIFKDYLEKIGVDKETIENIIKLDVEITSMINVEEHTNFEWNVLKFGAENFRSYGEFDIDWRDKDGLFQITGKNQFGKTSILGCLSYILYGSSLETDTKMKFGDIRFVNNRNNAKYCSAYAVIESGGQFFGLKRRTDIVRSRDNQITKTPTTLTYYLLDNPDTPLDDNSALDKLDEENRNKTQKIIDSVIGTYENFTRVIMTTSDTLNRILSNDMAVFIDSLLFDSGLDIFDKKGDGLKVYKKKMNEKPRVTCNVEATNNQIVQYNRDIDDINVIVGDVETNKLPTLNESLKKGSDYVETLTKKLYKIDPDIYLLNVDDVKDQINRHNENIDELTKENERLFDSISQLVDTYDENLLNNLLEKKENHKTFEYNEKIRIKESEQRIRDFDHEIELVNGQIYNIKKEGAKIKQQIIDLVNSKICPMCKQDVTPEHQKHIDENINNLRTEVFSLAKQYDDKEKLDIPAIQLKIDNENTNILNINENIRLETEKMYKILKDIGDLQNKKNDVEIRNVLVLKKDQIPTKINNERLNIKLLQQKIDNYDNSLVQIDENKKTEAIIVRAKERIELLKQDILVQNNIITTNKIKIVDIQNNIKNKTELIKLFDEQEKQDKIISLYESCVHRNGIPRQMLTSYILPKINETLSRILSVSQFNVWLDIDDLKPKLVFNDRPEAIIDCISSSGKERTFASIVLKFALNQINVKSKPTIFLLDEVMGKLYEESVDEFVEILQLIKSNMKKVLIIEHVHPVNPDYVIAVDQDSDGISSLTLE